MSGTPCTPSPTSIGLRTRLDALFAAHDSDGALDAVSEALAGGLLGVEDLYCAVLVPLLTDVGERWHSGRMRVWEEHLESAAISSIIECARPRVRAARDAVAAAHDGARPRSALFACPPEEWHVLSLRMLADRFAMEGWRTHYLGGDVPIEEIVDAARALGADLVVLTAATHYERVYLRDLLDGLRRQLAPVSLLVSGPAFSAEHPDWSADELVDPERLPDAYA